MEKIRGKTPIKLMSFSIFLGRTLVPGMRAGGRWKKQEVKRQVEYLKLKWIMLRNGKIKINLVNDFDFDESEQICYAEQMNEWYKEL